MRGAVKKGLAHEDNGENNKGGGSCWVTKSLMRPSDAEQGPHCKKNNAGGKAKGRNDMPHGRHVKAVESARNETKKRCSHT